MEPVVIACSGCGAAIRIRRPDASRRWACPRCRGVLPFPPEARSESEPPWDGEHATPADDPPHRPSPPRRPLLAGLAGAALLGALVISWSLPASRTDPQASPGTLVDPAPAVGTVPVEPPPLALRDETRPDPPATDAAPPPPPQSVTVDAAPVPPDAPRPFPLARGAFRLVQTLRARSAGLPLLRATDRPQAAPPPPVPAVGTPASLRDERSAADEPRRFRVRDAEGRSTVARLHGRQGGRSVLMLPDGQLGVPNLLVPTDEPFRPLSADELAAQLQDGSLRGFLLHRTAHYLIFYQESEQPAEVEASRRYAEAGGRLLEALYLRLLETFRKHAMPVHEAEFPLVAVVYRTEREFRAGKPIAPEVQAYYEIYTNRIHLYERSDRDDAAPEISAMRKPQTVAHEGTHQILQNIGVHARLAEWPLWLVEGLAEYCAAPAGTRRGKPTWDGPGMINGLHMATIRELDDPLSVAFRGPGATKQPVTREPGKPLVESLIRKDRLTPTEYALAWAMTHYLAVKREDDFVRYLKAMSEIPPLAPRTPEDHVREFQQVFGDDLAKLDRAIDAYLRKLSKQKGYDPMPYYAVVFEQALPTGVRRAAMVSQSPQMIRQTIEELRSPHGAEPSWHASPHPTRARALLAIDAWLRGF